MRLPECVLTFRFAFHFFPFDLQFHYYTITSKCTFSDLLIWLIFFLEVISCNVLYFKDGLESNHLVAFFFFCISNVQTFLYFYVYF